MKQKIYIYIDGLRRDYLMQYGYFINNMPRMTNYLSQFQKLDMYSPSAWTPTVLSSIFSATMPWEHKVLRPYTHSDKAILNKQLENNSQVELLPGKRIFVTSNPWILNNDKNGFLNGWHEVNSEVGVYNYGDSKVISELGQKYILDNKKNDFSLFLHFMDIHGPLNNDTSLCNYILDEDEKHILQNINDYEIDYDGFRSKSDLDMYYNAHIRRVDYYVSKLLNLLDEQDLWKNVEIVIFSDHGQNLCDKHNIPEFNIINRHGLLFMEGIHVPCFVWSKNLYNIHKSYSLVDLFGRLKPRGQNFSFIANHHNKVWGSITDGKYKLIYDYIKEFCFCSDLINDPRELNMEIIKPSEISDLFAQYLTVLFKTIDIEGVKEALGGNLETEPYN